MTPEDLDDDVTPEDQFMTPEDFDDDVTPEDLDDDVTPEDQFMTPEDLGEDVSVLHSVLRHRQVLQLPGVGRHSHQARQRPTLSRHHHLQHESTAGFCHQRDRTPADQWLHQTTEKAIQLVALITFAV